MSASKRQRPITPASLIGKTINTVIALAAKSSVPVHFWYTPEYTKPGRAPKGNWSVLVGDNHKVIAAK